MTETPPRDTRADEAIAALIAMTDEYVSLIMPSDPAHPDPQKADDSDG